MTALLTERVAIVTGGGGGIGAATCTRFADEGARVVVVDNDSGRAHTVAESVDGVAVVADITTPDGVGAALAAADALGGVDVLVNNVGHFLFARHDFVDSTPAEWNALHQINLLHVLTMTQAALPGMMARRRGGSIINFSTIEAHRGIPQHVIYSTYKAAVEGFTRSLALEVGTHGIRVNCIAPDMTESVQVRIHEWVTPERAHLVPSWIPLGRLGTADDLAGAALFLASDLSAFITGTTLHPNGGTLVAGGWVREPSGGWTSQPVQSATP